MPRPAAGKKMAWEEWAAGSVMTSSPTMMKLGQWRITDGRIISTASPRGASAARGAAPQHHCEQHSLYREQHQNGAVAVPLWSNGKVDTYSFRSWGDLMAAVWSTEENKDYGYMDFYM